jgi:hypothetical protein
MYLGKKRVGVAENPRSGVGARGSSVKKGFPWGERLLFFGTHVFPLLNLLTVGEHPHSASSKYRTSDQDFLHKYAKNLPSATGSRPSVKSEEAENYLTGAAY